MRILMIAACLLVCACASPTHNYAGSPGSVYDQAAEPPRVFAPSAYDVKTPVMEQDFGNSGAGAERKQAPN